MSTIPIRQQLPALVLLTVISLAVFANTLGNDFIWDDPHLIEKNQAITRISNIPLFFTPHYWNHLHPFASDRGEYRPLRTATFAMDYFFWKLNPAGYHLTNLLLHTANVWLIFYLLLGLYPPAAARGYEQSPENRPAWLIGLPFLTALLFATHPIHTESVAYIKNRSDLLSFFFYLSALGMFIANRPPISRIKNAALTTGALACFILAILAKEMALTLPGALVLYAACSLSGKDRIRAFIRVLPYGVLIGAYFGFKQLLLTSADPVATDYVLYPGPHLLAIIKTLGTYLALLAFPVNLNAERFFLVPMSIREPAVIISLAALIFIAIPVINLRQRARTVIFSITWILLTLIPAINIVFISTRPIAEQRLYIPSFGFCLLLAWGINRLYYPATAPGNRKTRKTAAVAVMLLIVGGYCFQTIQRNADWRDPVTFYGSAIQRNPDSFRMHNNLGKALAEKGLFAEAARSFQAALNLMPDDAEILANLGMALAAQGRARSAIPHLRTALKLNPGLFAAHLGLGKALINTGQLEEALRHYLAAARLKPDVSRLYNEIGILLMRLKRPEEAVAHYQRALTQTPADPNVYANLGVALLASRDYKAASEIFTHVLRLNPEDRNARRAIAFCRQKLAEVAGPE